MTMLSYQYLPFQDHQLLMDQCKKQLAFLPTDLAQVFVFKTKTLRLNKVRTNLFRKNIKCRSARSSFTRKICSLIFN